MSHLEKLKKNLLEMTPEELRAKVNAIRADRRLTKTSTKVRKERVRVNDSAATALKKLTAGMSDEEVTALLAELEG